MKLIVKNLSKKINNKVIFSNISFEIENGILLIRGKNGSGKTTLLKIIAGFERKTKGDIIYDDISKFEISYLGHKLGLYPELTVYENLKFFSNEKNFMKLFEYFELVNFLEYKVKYLSRGNIQKAAIVRALIKDAKVYLFDEPFVSLDEISKRKLENLIMEYSNDKIFIITSHEDNLFKSFPHQLLILDQ
ncbi:MAG: ABC transporter ATP-binding protein [candidate division WOR-3 bacterium]|nr:ABC transporter ATP-binding protein [candidate division WOR-3 bacterium]MCX7947079.1 ABC transporter ATP-binding protein [candidate division WOR-3 bacterium]MDW8149880.1 ABC transporter ATP-binding protein [candidate division WOR-3 bacterium]